MRVHKMGTTTAAWRGLHCAPVCGMFRVMPVSLDFLRGVLAVFAVIFAHFAGRSAVAVRRHTVKLSRLYAWVLRTLVVGLAITLRHPIDTMIVAVWLVCLVAFALGWWDAGRARKVEDLSISPE